MTSAAPPHDYAPHERPTFPGSPYTPAHTPGRRLGYAAMGLAAGLCCTLGNGLVNVNLANLSGSLGLYVVQASLLPAVYVAFNASANLMLVKARAQFGIPLITQGLLVVYALAALLAIVLPGFVTAVIVRAACGMAAAALITFGIYNWMQILPPRMRPLALVLGIGLPQLALPIARLFPVEILALSHWRGLYLAELSIALGMLAASLALPLPPSDRGKAFEALDVLTYGLALGAMLLLCGALGVGRLLWWTDTPVLGWALAGAIVLSTTALLVEQGRARPLLQLHWLSSLDILRFAGVALLVRLALAEQTYGAVGLLTAGGLNNDQLRVLFAIVAGAMTFGLVAAVLTLSERRLPYQVLAAALIIALGAAIDTGATNLTRPPQLYLSQALIGFGTTLFVGPALIYGFLRMFQRGADHLVSFVVLFSTTQNVGGLLGSALLGTYQVAAARFHASALSDHLVAADPLVVARLQAGAASLGGAINDPVLRSAQGAALLSQAMTREASILAYNDVFRLIAALALGTAAYVGYLIAIHTLKRGGQTGEANA